MMLLRRSTGILAQYQARGVVHKAGSNTGQYDDNGHSRASRESQPQAGSPAVIVQGLEGRESQFTASKDRALSGQVLEYEIEHGGHKDGPPSSVKPDADQVDYMNGEDTQKYDAGDCGVSLYSVMQSQVPDPFNPHGRNPTHLNMPGGGQSQQQKYLSNHLQNSHPSRQFSTHSPKYAFPAAVLETGGSPQGVQGDNCVQYKLWLENCQRFNLDCDDQVQGIQGGRKTLAEVFAEQEDLIRRIAEDFKKVTSGRKSPLQVNEGGSSGNMQGLQDTDWLAGHTVTSLSQLSNPCPQGIQGDNCDRFKLWLDNCSKYHFIDCEDQLQDVKSGRKNLRQIFEEQEQLIEEIALHYVAQQESTGSGGGSEVGSEKSPSPSSNPGNEGPKLTQREKLKRAVKEYGATVVVFHVGISLMSLGGFYLAVSSGLDVVGMLQKLGVGQSILESRLATGTSTFVIAYAVHKVFAPVRIATTLTATPFIVRYLRRAGILKPPKPKLS